MLLVTVGTVALTGGTAFAANGGPHFAVRSADGVVTTNTDSSSSSTDPATGSTDTTDPNNGGTSTSVATDTTVPGTDTSTSTTPGTTCKPGWGYGDTNHCHSGPPGLTHKPDHPDAPNSPHGNGHGHGHGHH